MIGDLQYVVREEDTPESDTKTVLPKSLRLCFVGSLTKLSLGNNSSFVDGFTRVSRSFAVAARGAAGGDAEETGDKLRLGECESEEPKASDPTVDNTEVGDPLSRSEGETDLLA